MRGWPLTLQIVDFDRVETPLWNNEREGDRIAPGTVSLVQSDIAEDAMDRCGARSSLAREQNPLDASTANSDVRTTRRKLQRVLDSMPARQPDNSSFKGQPDGETLKRSVGRQLASIS